MFKPGTVVQHVTSHYKLIIVDRRFMNHCEYKNASYIKVDTLKFPVHYLYRAGTPQQVFNILDDDLADIGPDWEVCKDIPGWEKVYD